MDVVDTGYLQTLMGYNARRAALSIIEVFLERLAPYGLKPVDFSVMSTICHNPGVTSRQLCNTLSLLPPNLVGLIQSLESRGLIERRPHPHDGRAVGLHATPQGPRFDGSSRKNGNRTGSRKNRETDTCSAQNFAEPAAKNLPLIGRKLEPCHTPACLLMRTKPC